MTRERLQAYLRVITTMHKELEDYGNGDKRINSETFVTLLEVENGLYKAMINLEDVCYMVNDYGYEEEL